MITVVKWLEDYMQVNERLLGILREDAGHYSDGKLASLEATLDLRQQMLDELSGYDIKDEDRSLYTHRSQELKTLEASVEDAVKHMMAEVKAEQVSLQNQRRELGKFKRANRSYMGGSASAEGYFLDKKK